MIQLLNILKNKTIIVIVSISFIICIIIGDYFYNDATVLYAGQKIIPKKTDVYIRFYFSSRTHILAYKDNIPVSPYTHNDFLYFFAEERFHNVDSIVVKNGYINIIDSGDNIRWLKYLKDHLILFPLILFIFPFILQKRKFLLRFIFSLILVVGFNSIFMYFTKRVSFNVPLYIADVFIISYFVYLSISFNEADKIESINHNKWHVIFILFPILYGLSYIYLYLSAVDFPIMRDMYHIGEIFAQYEGLKYGLPYKDVFILHGLFQDPYEVQLGFFLFGNYIGAYYIISTIIVIVTGILFIYMAWKILPFNRFVWFLMVFYIYGYMTFIITDRLLPIIIFLIIYKVNLKKEYLIYCVSFAFLYSIDTGFVVFIMFGIVMLSSQKIKFTRFLLHAFISFILFLWFIKFQLISFGEHVIYLISNYGKEWFFLYKFPSVEDITIYAFLPIIGHGILTAYFVKKYRQRKLQIFDVLLYISAILFFYGAINRGDYASIAGGFVISFLAIFYFIDNDNEMALFAVILMFFFAIPSYATYKIKDIINVKKEIYLITQLDNFENAFYLPEDYRSIYTYLMGEKENMVYVLSSEGIWYYLLNTPYYTKYMEPILAVTEEEQKEVVNSIDENNIGYIICDENSWFYRPEEKKIITRYIKSNYIEIMKKSDIVLYKRKGYY